MPGVSVFGPSSNASYFAGELGHKSSNWDLDQYLDIGCWCLKWWLNVLYHSAGPTGIFLFLFFWRIFYILKDILSEKTGEIRIQGSKLSGHLPLFSSSSELNRKWNDQDLNWLPQRMLALQAVALSVMPQLQLKYFLTNGFPINSLLWKRFRST